MAYLGLVIGGFVVFSTVLAWVSRRPRVRVARQPALPAGADAHMRSA
jgi:hypothetical protein